MSESRRKAEMMVYAAAAEASGASGSLTRHLIQHTRSFECAGLPGDVRELGRQCLLDWIGVTVAGAADPLPHLMIDEALAEGGKPLATVVGRSLKVAPLQAALINGTASHVLDYDDVNLSINGHPSAAILPALIALAEVRKASGAELLGAFVAGYEMACRVGVLVGPGHGARGYHATCTVGAVAAATACAHLLRLDAERTAHAVGIAATQASGLRSMFGTQCKAFHAGLASHNGLRAAQLAASGMTSRTDVLECAQGFASCLSPDFHPNAALAAPEKFYIRDNLFKYHASCYGTHAAIECGLRLRDTHTLEPRHIERITVRVNEEMNAMCNIAIPTSGIEARFSLRFMTAAALLGADTAGLALFDDAAVNDFALCAMRDKIGVKLVEDSPLVQAEVLVEFTDGRSARAVHDAALPDRDHTHQAQRLRAKFERLVTPLFGAARCGAILQLLAALEQTSVTDLADACAAASHASFVEERAGLTP